MELTQKIIIIGSFLVGFSYIKVNSLCFSGNLLAGGGAGVATFLVIYPLDFVRTRLAIDLGRNKKVLFCQSLYLSIVL